MVNIKLVILYLSMCALPATSQEIAWHIQNNDRNDLLIRRHTAISAEYNVHPDHSCYEASRDSSTLRFCYPSVIISGIPKAGTSASYELLKEHPSFEPGHRKENCMALPYSNDALWEYFKTLANQTEAASKTGGNPKRLLSGCISIIVNLKLHEILRHPNTLYLLMTRDLSDLMWATYNFWCSPKYDGVEHCVDQKGRWADAQYHYRSPTLFHDLLVAQVEGKKQYGMGPLHYDICDEKSAGFYRDHENRLLGAGIEVDRILFIANEELSSNASSVWNKLTRAIGIVDREEKKHPSLKKFETFRVNTGAYKNVCVTVMTYPLSTRIQYDMLNRYFLLLHCTMLYMASYYSLSLEVRHNINNCIV